MVHVHKSAGMIHAISSFQALNSEVLDLKRIPMDEIFEQLRCTKEGLSMEEGGNRPHIFGYNKLEEKCESKFLKFLVANGPYKGESTPPDWEDFMGIVFLLLINSTISFIEENNDGNVLRDGRWSEKDAFILVLGDIIGIKIGDIVRDDAPLLEGDHLKIVQSALTGESLPVTEKPKDEVFSGSTCKQGEIEAIVIATDVHCFFEKSTHLVDSTYQVDHFKKVLTSIGNFCICVIALGMVVEITIMYTIQDRAYREGINNLLVLLIGGILIAMPTVLSVTMAIGSHRLLQQEAITKRMTAIEELTGMDVLCSDKTGKLTLDKLRVDKNLVECFLQGVDRYMVVLLAARASRIENQDSIDTSIVGMLADLKDTRASIREVHFLLFNPMDKASKGAPEQILSLVHNKNDIEACIHAIIHNKESEGRPWHFCGLMCLFDPPRHDSIEMIRRALSLGVNDKMIMGLQNKNEMIASPPMDELIENKDGFTGHHICGMSGDGVNDARALKKADIDNIIDDATNAARSAFNIVLTEPGLSVIMSDVLMSRAIFEQMKNYTIYEISFTIRIILGFLLLALIWKFDFSPFMVLIIAILNDGTIMTISRDRTLREIFATNIVVGSCLALMKIVFFWVVHRTIFFRDKFGHRGLYLMLAFVVAQVVATLLAIYSTWGFANINGIGLHWVGLIWLYSFITFLPLDLIKVAFTRKKDYEKEEKEVEWAHTQCILHGLHPSDQPSNLSLFDKSNTEIMRLREFHILKGLIESIVRLKGLDIGTIQQA
ncbi:hypothetical protein KP509_02G114100 [Ceratopteris richardii]|uniref:P-type ATPase A domain-containing protein n=1 Tax=Ceratopteris richardii TaxID=49495 RepID=A0A8T2V9R8_CERRI|nr:hypothetical protein KP509_02G114100 [Ceratopteris richardii]